MYETHICSLLYCIKENIYRYISRKVDIPKHVVYGYKHQIHNYIHAMKPHEFYARNHFLYEKQRKSAGVAIVGGERKPERQRQKSSAQYKFGWLL